MRSVALLIFLLVAIGGGMAYMHFSPTEVKKREVRASLMRFSQAVATKDRAKVSAALGELLTDDAKIRLEIHFFSIGNNRPMMEQNFDKPQFIQFIDNTLYSLTDYSYIPQLTSLDAATDKVAFTSVESADGPNMMGGISVDMRYGADTECDGTVAFENNIARLRQATCKLQFHQVPKPGQEHKFSNLNSLSDLLRQQH